MTKENKINKYVEEWYGWMLGEVMTNIAKDGMKDYGSDLLHTIIIDLYNLPADKITQMVDDDKLRWYILRGCSLQLRSSTSPFYRIHRRERMQARENYTSSSKPEYNGSFSGVGILEREYEPYDDVIERLSKCLQDSMTELGFYHRTLLEKHFMEKWSIQRIHKHYQISKTHIVKDINYGLDYVREFCKEC